MPFALLLFAAVVTSALAEDETVPESKVPDAVKASVAKKYPGSLAGLWSIEANGIYETKMKREVAVRVTAAGKILEEREEIPIDQVPEVVKKAVAASEFGKGTIKKARRYVTDEKIDQAQYNVDVALDEWQGEKGEFLFDVTFDSTGKRIED
jgi:hypothetical protein